MGGCASRPKEFDSAAAPEPAEAPDTTEKVVAAQEEVEVEKEEPKEAPLVDLSEPAEAAPAEAAATEEEKKEEEKEEEKAEETTKAEGEEKTAAPSS